MSIIRKHAVEQGRSMIRVRYIKSGDPATVGVCPGCWNIKERRKVLLFKLQKMGLEVVHKNDTLEGVYNYEKEHAPLCPYRKVAPDPWKRFGKEMGKFKRNNPLR